MKPTIIGAVVYSERKFPTLFPEDHNNSQCFVFTKMSGSGSCRIHPQRYEETGKKQNERGFIFIFYPLNIKFKRLNICSVSQKVSLFSIPNFSIFE
jgi:hypothetical protein